MTRAEREKRVERWAQATVDFWDAANGEPATQFARRIVRAIERARREERKACAAIVTETPVYGYGERGPVGAKNAMLNAILGAKKGAGR